MRVLRSFLAGMLVLLLSGCKQEEIRSTWTQLPPKVDGSMEDWQNSPLAVFEDEHLALGVRNDSNYLYLAGRIADASVQRITARSGMTFWVDPDGGESQDIEIHFPATSYGIQDQTRGGFWQSMTEEQKERARKRTEDIGTGVLVVDKRNVESRVYPASGPAGFAAGIVQSTGFLSFEVRIPLNIPNYFSGLSPLGKNGKVGVGMMLGSARGEVFRGSRGGGGGGPLGPFGGRGRRGGGRGGGVPRRGGESNGSSSEIWVAVDLATAK